MTHETARSNPGIVSLAFNATKYMADGADQTVWRRADLMARADRAFRHLHSLKPGGAR